MNATYNNVRIFIFLIIIMSMTGSLSAQKLNISGGISAGAHRYFHNGINPRQPEFGYSLSAAARLSFHGVSIPVLVSINEQGSRFESPFNRFGISPQYKWVKVHLGWRAMQFSNYSLSNVSFLGAGVELTPGKWRISGMYGRFREAARLTNSNYRVSQFERSGYAIKLGYGSQTDYVDLIFFKAKDDESSLSDVDSTGLFIKPQENAVLGMKTQLTFFDNSLRFHFDGGISAFSENTNLEGFEESPEWIHSVSGIFRPNISSHINYAGETGLGWFKRNYSLGLLYRRVMPDYKSMGINYLLNDQESYTINPQMYLFQRKLVVGGSFGIQRNNLDEWRQRQNDRVISNVNVQISPSPYWGLNVQFSNFSFKQQIVRDTLIREQLFFHQVNRNWLISPRYIIKTNGGMHTLVGSINLQTLDNVTSETSDGNSSINLYALNYAWSSDRNYRISVSANYFNYSSDQISLERIGSTMGFSIDFFDKKLNASLSGGLQHSLTKEEMSWHGALDMKYRLTKSLTITSRARFWSSGSVSEEREGKAEIRISQRF